MAVLWAFADLSDGVGYAYVTSQMGTQLTRDPRDVARSETCFTPLFESCRFQREIGGSPDMIVKARRRREDIKGLHSDFVFTNFLFQDMLGAAAP